MAKCKRDKMFCLFFVNCMNKYDEFFKFNVNEMKRYSETYRCRYLIVQTHSHEKYSHGKIQTIRWDLYGNRSLYGNII